MTGAEVKDAYVTASKGGAERIGCHFDPGCYINSGGLAFFIEIASESRKNKQAAKNGLFKSINLSGRWRGRVQRRQVRTFTGVSLHLGAGRLKC